jgi:hypothetical protein
LRIYNVYQSENDASDGKEPREAGDDNSATLYILERPSTRENERGEGEQKPKRGRRQRGEEERWNF